MALSKDEINLILKLVDLSLQYGIPMISTAINLSEKEILTQEDIDDLKIEKGFEDY